MIAFESCLIVNFAISYFIRTIFYIWQLAVTITGDKAANVD
jgi:hypothetical protein